MIYNEEGSCQLVLTGSFFILVLGCQEATDRLDFTPLTVHESSECEGLIQK